MDTERQAHWENVYQTKAETEVSWFQQDAAPSRDMIHSLGVAPGSSVIDVGGGASRLVDALLDEGFAVTVLDLSAKALVASRARLGSRADEAHWIAADVTLWEPETTFDLWHDRAAFHFLTDAGARAAYAERVARAVRPGGHVMIATFALDGPERCSGLPVMRHDAASIGAVLGEDFALIEMRRHNHLTPSGAVQKFQFSGFRRKS
ncbi:MAG: class I SAM-dependent methyltransferase [Methylovirgula sp.]